MAERTVQEVSKSSRIRNILLILLAAGFFCASFIGGLKLAGILFGKTPEPLASVVSDLDAGRFAVYLPGESRPTVISARIKGDEAEMPPSLTAVRDYLNTMIALTAEMPIVRNGEGAMVDRMAWAIRTIAPEHAPWLREIELRRLN